MDEHDNKQDVINQEIAKLNAINVINLKRNQEMGEGPDNSPIPLVSERAIPEFPIEALGSLIDPCMAIYEHTQAPLAMVAQTMLSAVSICAQSHRDILFCGFKRPISLFTLCIAKSGERKTTVFNLCYKAITKKQTSLNREFEERTKELRLQNMKGREVELCQPLAPNIIVSDITLEGLVKLQVRGQPSMGLCTTEAASFFGGYAMKRENKIRTLAELSNYWEGEDIVRVRSDKEQNVFLENPRLSVAFAVQPEIISSYLKDAEIVGQGMLSRFLIMEPKSRIGERNSSIKSGKLTDPAYKEFQNRLTELLNAPWKLRDGSINTLELPTLGFSNEAAQELDAFLNEIEKKMAPQGPYENITGFASKATENAARIAGCFTVYREQNPSEISADTMQDAIKIMRYYLEMHLHVMSIMPDIERCSLLQKDVMAEELRAWIVHYLAKENKKIIKRKMILQYSKSKFRDKRVLDEMLPILEDYRWLIPADGGGWHYNHPKK